MNKISTITKTYARKINILEGKLDNSIFDYKSQIRGFWTNGDRRKNNAFKVPNSKDFIYGTKKRRMEKQRNLHRRGSNNTF